MTKHFLKCRDLRKIAKIHKFARKFSKCKKSQKWKNLKDFKIQIRLNFRFPLKHQAFTKVNKVA